MPDSISNRTALGEQAIESALDVARDLRVIPNADRLGGVQALVKFHAHDAVPEEIAQERSPRIQTTSQQCRHYLFDAHPWTVEVVGRDRRVQ